MDHGKAFQNKTKENVLTCYKTLKLNFINNNCSAFE